MAEKVLRRQIKREMRFAGWIRLSTSRMIFRGQAFAKISDSRLNEVADVRRKPQWG